MLRLARARLTLPGLAGRGLSEVSGRTGNSLPVSSDHIDQPRAGKQAKRNCKHWRPRLPREEDGQMLESRGIGERREDEADYREYEPRNCSNPDSSQGRQVEGGLDCQAKNEADGKGWQRVHCHAEWEFREKRSCSDGHQRLLCERDCCEDANQPGDYRGEEKPKGKKGGGDFHAERLSCGRTFELTPTAQAGGVSPVRDDATPAADRAYVACRSGSGVERVVRHHLATMSKALMKFTIAAARSSGRRGFDRCCLPNST